MLRYFYIKTNNSIFLRAVLSEDKFTIQDGIEFLHNKYPENIEVGLVPINVVEKHRDVFC